MDNPLLNSDPFADLKPAGSPSIKTPGSKKTLTKTSSTVKGTGGKLADGFDDLFESASMTVSVPPTSSVMHTSSSHSIAAQQSSTRTPHGVHTAPSPGAGSGPHNPLGGPAGAPLTSANLNKNTADMLLFGSGGGGGAGAAADPFDIDALLANTSSTMRPVSKQPVPGAASPRHPGGQGQPRRNLPPGSPQRRRTKGQQYTRAGDLCWDEVTTHHCLCFPCALDGVYEAMNDPGFTSCSVFCQSALLGLLPGLWPLYWLCCCVQSYAIRQKFSSIIEAKEEKLEIIVSAMVCPCVITAGVHREIELRGQPVWTAALCSDKKRVYSSDLIAPSMPDMKSDGRKLPYLVKDAPFGGGTMDRSSGDRAPVLQLPVVDDFCGHQVRYNSWRHCLLLCFGLSTDCFLGCCEVGAMCCGQ